MTDYAGLKLFTRKQLNSNWYQKFCAMYDAGDLTALRRKVFKEKFLFQQLEPFIDWYPGKVGPQITRSELFTVRYPEAEPSCVICGSECSFGGRQWKTTCSVRCASKECVDRRKATCLERYGVDNPSRDKATQKRREQTFMRNYGVSNPFADTTVQKKIRKTNRERYGEDNPSQSAQVQAKKEATSLRRFGHVHWTRDDRQKHKIAVFNAKTMQKAKDTMLKRHGVENPFDSDEFQELARETVKDLYGVTNVFASPEVQEKIRKTCLDRYGVENPGWTKDSQRKIKKTNLLKYGVEHAGSLGWYRTKKVTDAFGKIHCVQGYEDRVVLDVSKQKSVKRIVSDAAKLPKIKYKGSNGNLRTYYPDLGVVKTSGKALIEVKSGWTLNVDLKNNLAKFASATDYCEGKKWDFWVVVYHNKGVSRVKNPRTLQDLKNAGLPVSRRLLSSR